MKGYVGKINFKHFHLLYVQHKLNRKWNINGDLDEVLEYWEVG